ncbi:hypothetical protein [Roseibium sp.]|uniref:hypothetical protein n=1 Tax=Roseibium sp. TaxID=1936156 RepID=UPI003B51AB6B
MQSKWVLAVAVVLALPFASSSPVSAGSTSEYEGQCTYRNGQDKIDYNGPCEINAGIIGRSSCEPGDFRERFILTYPASGEVWIYIRCDGTGTANGIGAVAMKSPGTMRLLLTNGESFRFTDKSEWRCEKDCAYYYPELYKAAYEQSQKEPETHSTVTFEADRTPAPVPKKTQ